MKTDTLRTVALACAASALTWLGMAAQTRPYTIALTDFNELQLRGSVNVDHRISTDSAGLVVFDATEEMVPWIEAECKKGKMKINVDVPKELGAVQGLPTLRVYSTSLLRVENDGDSALRLLSPLHGPTFSARVVGNGVVSVRSVQVTDVSGGVMAGRGQLIIDSGKCLQASFTLAGTGNIQADGLAAVRVSCKCTGTGSVGVWAAEELSVNGAGSSTIYYRGDPVITKKISLGLKLERLD